MIIHIEIGKSNFRKDLLKMRIGNLDGCIEHCNITKQEALRDISDEIDSLLESENEVLCPKTKIGAEKKIVSTSENPRGFPSEHPKERTSYEEGVKRINRIIKNPKKRK